jgi:hypothetical protein
VDEMEESLAFEKAAEDGKFDLIFGRIESDHVDESSVSTSGASFRPKNDLSKAEKWPDIRGLFHKTSCLPWSDPHRPTVDDQVGEGGVDGADGGEGSGS